MREGATSRFHEQRIDVPMITAIELDDLVAPGETAGQTNARHGRFRATIDHAHFFD